MKFFLRISLLLLLVTGTLAQDFNLGDALDDPEPTGKPKEQTKAPEKPGSDVGDGLDLADAFGPDEPVAPVKPNKPSSGGAGGDGLDLGDALGPDEPVAPVKPNKPSSGGAGGGGTFGDSDLLDIGGGDYKPDPGRPNAGGGANTNQDSHGGADQPQEAGSGKIAGIVSAIGVALLGAASSYFAYQKKKLCFKIQGGTDPEKGHQGTQSDPQVFSSLLKTS